MPWMEGGYVREQGSVTRTVLDGLMKGRTVIAVAHRRSTIARMDRRVLGIRHARAAIGAEWHLYGLWRRQSGGFTPELLGAAAK
jgi:ATP-binding cassette, subfamily B, multidrug efflux pump